MDQFEELFTLCHDAFEREAFVDNLLGAVEPGGPVAILIALRADQEKVFEYRPLLSYYLAVAASGLVHTQLGPGEFLDNFAVWAPQIKTTQTVREPYPAAVEAPISMDDIARVAAALLVKPDESHFGRMYPITGPEALTRAQIAEQIGAGIGVPINYEQCERAEAEAAFQKALGPNAAWYLDQVEDAVNHPQDANDLVA